MTLWDRTLKLYDWAKPRAICLFDLARYTIMHPKFLAGFASAAAVCWMFH